MVVYKITNKINNKIYIGQTTQPLQKRWNEHCHYNKSVIASAIKKYGKENFEIRVITRCDSAEELNHRETYYIKLFNSRAPNGYNLKSGGARGKHSEETLKKLSLALKGRIGPNKGKKFTKEHRENISKAHIGHTFKWKNHTYRAPYMCKGRSNHRKGVIPTIESRLKCAISRGAGKFFIVKNTNNDIVWQGLFQIQCAKELQLSVGNINQCLHGKRKQTKGYTFEYGVNDE